MVKKLSLTFMLCVLLCSTLVFVSCEPEPIPAPAPTPNPKTPVEDVLGTVGENIVYNGDFETGSETDVTADGSSMVLTPSVGVNGSSAMAVLQNETYGEVYVDFTSDYGRGKSYLISASFKNNGSTNTSDLTARISFTVVSGAVMDAVGKYGWEAYYDCDDIYGGELLSDDEAEEVFGMVTNVAGETIVDDKYVTVSGILPATVIEDLLVSTTDKYGSGDPTMAMLLATIYVGTYPNQNGYSYYLDNVVIKDLNSELKRQGRTYKAPDTGDDDDDE